MTTDKYTSILNRLESESERWAPEPGDTLVGEVISIDTWEGEYGEVPVIEVEDNNGAVWRVLCSRSVLRNEVERLSPQVGDLMGIKYQGEKTSKKGTSFHAYRVTVSRGSRAASESSESTHDDEEEMF